MSVPGKCKPPLRDRLIPWYFVMAFAVVFIVNGIFATLAIQNNSGVVTENPYKKGLAYNHTIAEAERQEALGWQTTLDYENEIFRFKLTDAQSQPIIGASVHAYFSRPIEAGNEFMLPLAPQKDGAYAARVLFSMSGQWEITVNVIWKNQKYQTTKRLVVR